MKDPLLHELRPTTLVSIRLAAKNVNFYEFALLDSAPSDRFEPGSHINLYIKGDLVRQYSLLPAEPGLLRIAVQTVEDGRGGSRSLAMEARVGRVYLVSEANNHFPLAHGASHSVLIAGGIGITPIFGMVDELNRSGASWELHYAVKSDASAVLCDELRKYGEKVRIVRSDQTHDGRIKLSQIVNDAPLESDFYCCGPPRMIDEFIAATSTLPPEKVHAERFSATTELAAEGGFEVRLARSETHYTVPRGQTILQTLRDNGLDVPSSCEQGVCGVCETRVLSGTPDHRDHVLSAKEKAKGHTMMICCSGSQGPLLVLDL